MSIIENQLLNQLRDEIRSLRRDFVVICQQQTHTHQLLQQQQTMLHQLLILLLQKDSRLNSDNAQASAPMPSFPVTSYNFSNQSQSSLSIESSPNASFTRAVNIPVVFTRDSDPNIQRPEAAYPSVNPITGPISQTVRILPVQVGDVTKTSIQSHKAKRSRVAKRGDETVEKDRVEQNQYSNPTTLRFLQMGDKLT